VGLSVIDVLKSLIPFFGLNKRRKTIAMSFKDAMLAYVPVYGRKQLKDLYFAKP
jgi:hypothetical protein